MLLDAISKSSISMISRHVTVSARCPDSASSYTKNNATQITYCLFLGLCIRIRWFPVSFFIAIFYSCHKLWSYRNKKSWTRYWSAHM